MIWEALSGSFTLNNKSGKSGARYSPTYDLQVSADGEWRFISDQGKTSPEPKAASPNVITFEPQTAQKLRVVFKHRYFASGPTSLAVRGFAAAILSEN